MNTKNNYGALDYFKIIAAILIITIHTNLFISYNEQINAIFTGVVARIAVPFFFMVTGFFLSLKIGEKSKDSKNSMNIINKYVKKILIIYVLTILIYIPFNIFGGYFSRNKLSDVIMDILINGTFYHLWYLPALILGIYITYYLFKKLKMKHAVLIITALYIIGLFGDSYYGLIKDSYILSTMYEGIFKVFDYTRNGIFFAPMFLSLGYIISKNIDEIKNISYKKIFFAVSFILLLIEGIIVHKFNIYRHDSMYIMLIPTMYFLYIALLDFKCKSNKLVRKISAYMYILHPMVIVTIQFLSKKLVIINMLVNNSLIYCILVIAITCIISYILANLIKVNKKNNLEKIRTWAEIDLNNLEHNINEFKSVISKDTEIMAVVKADAYGHGYEEVSKRLNQIGIKYFAVAELIEAINLRKAGIKGDILILGYTMINEDTIRLVKKYNLTLTIPSKEYAQQLNLYNKKINVDIKVDTGMNRLGIDCNDIDSIANIYSYKNVIVKGIHSHLCVADSLKNEDIEFTKKQIILFKQVINKLKQRNINVGKTHIHSTYGVLNYYDSSFDIVRIGIGMYGVLSDSADTKLKLDLKPVLSLKSRIVLTRQIKKGNSVSYGRNYITDKDNTDIAVVPIGYADGLPRNLSNIGTQVIVNGKKTNIVGNICMDQLMIDITDIGNVNVGDIVTIVGKDRNEEINVAKLAEKGQTISNEILSRIGQRIIKVYK